MIYTENTKKALILGFEAHKEQKDKSGLPYVFHPFHLAEQMEDEDTTITALYCCLRYPDDFDKALIASVNHGGDSDSAGAVAGNIMGAVCGYDRIAKKWKAELELKDVILEIADDLAGGCRMWEFSDYTDEKWEHKYIHCDYTPERE